MILFSAPFTTEGRICYNMRQTRQRSGAVRIEGPKMAGRNIRLAYDVSGFDVLDTEGMENEVRAANALSADPTAFVGTLAAVLSSLMSRGVHIRLEKI